MATMRCPRCAHEQPEAAECRACGVVVAKARAAVERRAAKPPAASATPRPSEPPRAAQPRALSASTRQMVLRELAEMLDRGVPLPTALAALEPAMRRGEARRALAMLREAQADGRPLSEALAEAGADPVETALVRAAEATGRLGPTLRGLAGRLRREHEQLSGLRVALLQPFGLALAATVLLPVPLAVQRGLASYLGVAALGAGSVVVAAAALLFGLPAMLRRPGLRARWLAIGAALPGFGRVVRLRRMALFFGALGPGLEAGLLLDEALTLAAEATTEPGTQRTTAAIVETLRREGGLARAMGRLPGIDEETLARLAGGEASGGLADVAVERAETFAERHDVALRRTLSVVRMVAAGIVTLLVAAAITAQAAKIMGDPMSMMPDADRSALERELERAMPHRPSR